jgi:uncharacterized protein
VIDRPIWLDRINTAWNVVPVVWLSGVRRVGKTSLAHQFPGALFLNCDLPSSQQRLHDPERFLASTSSRTIVFDEVHQLPDPSRLLKISADTFPGLKILATGSSTLDATRKFRDSLTGRKRNVTLQPVLCEELPEFGVLNLEDRLFRGGLPPALLSPHHEPDLYAEWLDSYFARDVQELFHLEKRDAFLRCLQLLLRQSGGMLDLTGLAKLSGVTRPTINSWINVFQITHVVRFLRPFARGGRREIVAQPKIYGFDTGFISYAKGWDSLRPEDCGLLWEHVVLDTLDSIGGTQIHFWRDKQQREIDFILPRGMQRADLVECRWSLSGFSAQNIEVFRKNYSEGHNLVVCPEVKRGAGFQRTHGGLDVDFVAIEDLRRLMGPPGKGPTLPRQSFK